MYLNQEISSFPLWDLLPKALKQSVGYNLHEQS